MEKGASIGPNQLDTAPLFAINLPLDDITLAVFKNPLYGVQGKSKNLQCAPETEKLPVVFHSRSCLVKTTLGETWPQSLATNVNDVEILARKIFGTNVIDAEEFSAFDNDLYKTVGIPVCELYSQERLQGSQKTMPESCNESNDHDYEEKDWLDVMNFK